MRVQLGRRDLLRGAREIDDVLWPDSGTPNANENRARLQQQHGRARGAKIFKQLPCIRGYCQPGWGLRSFSAETG